MLKGYIKISMFLKKQALQVELENPQGKMFSI